MSFATALGRPIKSLNGQTEKGPARHTVSNQLADRATVLLHGEMGTSLVVFIGGIERHLHVMVDGRRDISWCHGAAPDVPPIAFGRPR